MINSKYCEGVGGDILILNESEFKKQMTSKDFKRVYLIYGEEKALVKKYSSMAVEKIMGKEPPEFNFHIFDGEASPDDIYAALGMVPFLSRYNMVVVRNMDFESLKSDVYSKMTQILKSVPDTSVLLFDMSSVEIEVKKAQKFKKLNDIVSKSPEGVSLCLEYRTPSVLAKQLSARAGKLGCSLSVAMAGKLVDMCGTDLNRLNNELNKLAAYASGGDITADMIELLVSQTLESNIYGLADSIVRKNSDRAFSILEGLFYQRVEPSTVVYNLAGAYTDMYRARVCAESGEPLSKAAELFNYKNRAFVLGKAQTNSAAVSTEALRDSLEEIVKTSGLMRSVSVDDKVLTEKLVAELLLTASKKYG